MQSRPSFLTKLAIAAALAVTLSAPAGAQKAPFKFPMKERDFRAYTAKIVDGMRAGLSRGGGRVSDAEHARIENQIRHINERTNEVCADGIVTQGEANYVLAVLSTSHGHSTY